MSGLRPGAYSEDEPEPRYRMWFPTLSDYTSSTGKPYAEVTGIPSTEHGSLMFGSKGKPTLIMAAGTWHSVEIIEEDK